MDRIAALASISADFGDQSIPGGPGAAAAVRRLAVLLGPSDADAQRRSPAGADDEDPGIDHADRAVLLLARLPVGVRALLAWLQRHQHVTAMDRHAHAVAHRGAAGRDARDVGGLSARLPVVRRASG